MPLSVCWLIAVLCCWLACSGGSWLSLSVGSARWWSWRAFAVYVCWLLLHFVLYLLVPGSRVRGVPLDKQGNRLDYSTNGQPRQHSEADATMTC